MGMSSRCWDNEAVRRLTLVGAWLLVVVVATTLTWQIVSAADDQVSDRAKSLNVAAPVLSSLTTTTTTTSTSLPTQTSTTSASGTSTTIPADTTDTTEPTTTTTTPAPDPAWQTKSVPTSGGTVVVRYRPGEVAYQAASPNKGFHVEVESYGPPEVEVKFESDSLEVEVHAVWRDNRLDVAVSDSGDD
jgi:cytoskeletal protein RodZ